MGAPQLASFLIICPGYWRHLWYKLVPENLKARFSIHRIYVSAFVPFLFLSQNSPHLWSHCWQSSSLRCDKPREVCLPPPCPPSWLSLKDASRLSLYYWVTQPAATTIGRIFFKSVSTLAIPPSLSFNIFPSKSNPSSGLSGSARVWFYAWHCQTINPQRLCLSIQPVCFCQHQQNA